tara:strand:- start:93 stop:257 length:165 start_codon:yes stop_codon:yes gene_type:complete
MREDEKRLTVALDGKTYKALRQLGLDCDMSNQAMMEAAIKEWLGHTWTGIRRSN